MIDDDFYPHRLQYRALGHLLVRSQIAPHAPSMREQALYDQVYERFAGSERRSWLDELAEHGLVQILPDAFRASDAIGQPPFDVCLTPAGVYYAVSRAHLFGSNARTPTDDFPDSIVDAPWAIQAYYSPPDDDRAPSADSFVRFDHNEEAYRKALDSIDEVHDALMADNEIGATDPEGRDRGLEELRAIRRILEQREGWRTKVIAVGWGALGYIMTEFADRPVGLLAEQAWHAVQALVGIG